MPKILLVKTSSMGDVIHNLPVVSDIHQRFPGATVDWVVEESFAQIPALHPGVRKTIPVALRRWRTSLMHPGTRQEVGAFHAALRGEAYDYVIDTQGLLKSALITRCARGRRAGYDWQSAREPLSALFYDRRFHVEKALHAVERNRRLAGLALAYEAQSFSLDYGIATAARKSPSSVASPYAVLLHATSRDDKLWQEERWADLGQRLAEAGVHSVLPWASDTEKARSTRLQAAIPHAVVPGTLGLRDAATLLAHAAIVVGVDTGLTHLAAAVGSSVVAIYVATSPGLTGVYGGARAVNFGNVGRSPSADEVLVAAHNLMVAGT